MQTYLIYLHLRPYVREWLVNAYGEPVKFPEHGCENAEIRRHLIPLPVGKTPDVCRPGDVAIVLPNSSRRKLTTYNYMPQSGKDCIAGIINDIFDCDLKSSVRESVKNRVPIHLAVRAWRIKHGISIEHENTLKQRINRMIMSLRKKNIQI